MADLIREAVVVKIMCHPFPQSAFDFPKDKYDRKIMIREDNPDNYDSHRSNRWYEPR